ncbi:MAG: N-acetylglucosamine-6-phosphate deacetylase [Akkermansiaceae bacterium]|nr:N-acetylglucosamine-6-phosphate deacetylase [Akkermansiaceae bacterium]MCP5550805.1 N-acetylglucosamine-6-phosphate deacetylase [Akkermansiaceae bacterium]
MRPFDIQVNGYAGADYCSADLTLEQTRHACDELAADGVDGILATVITDTVEALCAKLAKLVAFREADPAIARMIAGFHIEGPFLNAAPGYIGAHPPECVKPANINDMARLLDAAAGLTRLVTLAPENDPGFATTRFLAERGVTVSAGHCDPTLAELEGAIDAGLSMVTHLGNGCPVTLPRHENFIQRALSLSDRLWICYIPDGAHVPFFALKNYLAISGVERGIMVTDAISAAKLGPGLYELSGAPVEIDAEGVARRPGSPNLAGSTVTMPRVRENLARHLGLSEPEIEKLVSANPRRATGLDG